jgi:hypothetical protein
MDNYQDRIKPTDFGIGTYLGNIQAGTYQIPTFQRDVVWDKSNVKKLWDSVYKFYPLGSILVWRTPLTLYSHRKIGGQVLTPVTNIAEHRYILDGQQRTTSLYTSIFGEKVEGRDFDPAVYIDLTIKLKGATDDESYKDRFLFWDEIDSQGGTLLRNAGRQNRYNDGLIVPLRDIMFEFGKLDGKLARASLDYDAPEREQLRRMQSILANYRLSFIELHGIEVAEVCQIFERVNQAGKDLSIFDIVVAKTFRTPDATTGAPGFYLRDLIRTFRDTKLPNSNYASLDDDTFLQMVAMCIRLRQLKVKGKATVLNITETYLNVIEASDIEAVWDEAQDAMVGTFRFLDTVLRLNGPNLVPFRYFYMTLTAYLFENKAPDIALMQRYFWFTCFHRDDLLSNTTNMLAQIDALRSGDGSRVFEKGFTLDINQLRTTTYSSRGRMARAILALYANQDPEDWAPGHARVLNLVYYTLTDKPNLHHVFPMDYVTGSTLDHKELVHSLLNIAYLPQITNLKISNKNPLDYLGTYVGETEHDQTTFLDVLKRHLIPSVVVTWQATLSQLPPSALSTFIEQRLELVMDVLLKKLSGIETNVYDSTMPTLTATGTTGAAPTNNDTSAVEA